MRTIDELNNCETIAEWTPMELNQYVTYVLGITQNLELTALKSKCHEQITHYRSEMVAAYADKAAAEWQAMLAMADSMDLKKVDDDG